MIASGSIFILKTSNMCKQVGAKENYWNPTSRQAILGKLHPVGVAAWVALNSPLKTHYSSSKYHHIYLHGVFYIVHTNTLFLMVLDWLLPLCHRKTFSLFCWVIRKFFWKPYYSFWKAWKWHHGFVSWATNDPVGHLKWHRVKKNDKGRK